MVEKKSAISYESIMKDLKARKYSPVYVLMGEEPFYIDKICDYISENVLQPEERDFNQTVVFGADVTGAQVADLCKGYPMMAEYRVVVVKEAQNLRNLEALEKYLENPVKTTILVFCHKNGKLDSRKKFSASLPRRVWFLKARSFTTEICRASSRLISRPVRQPLNPRLPRWWQIMWEQICTDSLPSSTNCSFLFQRTTGVLLRRLWSEK